jgi:hypothetical protein
VLGGQISFGAAKGMVQRVNKLNDFMVLVLDFQGMSSLDTTTSRSIEDIVSNQHLENRTVIISCENTKLLEQLISRNTLDYIPPSRRVTSRQEALRLANQLLQKIT